MGQNIMAEIIPFFLINVSHNGSTVNSAKCIHVISNNAYINLIMDLVASVRQSVNALVVFFFLNFFQGGSKIFLA